MGSPHTRRSRCYPLQHVVGWGVCTVSVGVRTQKGVCATVGAGYTGGPRLHMIRGCPVTSLLWCPTPSQTNLACLTLPASRTEASALQSLPRHSTQPFTSTAAGAPASPRYLYPSSSYGVSLSLSLSVSRSYYSSTGFTGEISWPLEPPLSRYGMGLGRDRESFLRATYFGTGVCNINTAKHSMLPSLFLLACLLAC